MMEWDGMGYSHDICYATIITTRFTLDEQVSHGRTSSSQPGSSGASWLLSPIFLSIHNPKRLIDQWDTDTFPKPPPQRHAGLKVYKTVRVFTYVWRMSHRWGIKSAHANLIYGAIFSCGTRSLLFRTCHGEMQPGLGNKGAYITMGGKRVS